MNAYEQAKNRVNYNPLNNEFEGTSANVKRFAVIRRDMSENKSSGHAKDPMFRLENRARIIQ